jgi:hypothetical protein
MVGIALVAPMRHVVAELCASVLGALVLLAILRHVPRTRATTGLLPHHAPVLLAPDTGCLGKLLLGATLAIIDVVAAAFVAQLGRRTVVKLIVTGNARDHSEYLVVVRITSIIKGLFKQLVFQFFNYVFAINMARGSIYLHLYIILYFI